MALVENIQRQDLHYLDEAEACRAILREHGLTQEELARSLGRSPSALANRLRLLKLPENVRAALRECLGAWANATPARSSSCRTPACSSTPPAAPPAKKMSVRALEALVERLARLRPPQPSVKRVFRDGRMFVNAVLNTVRELNALGVPAASQVRRLPGRIEITVTLHGERAYGLGGGRERHRAKARPLRGRAGSERRGGFRETIRGLVPGAYGNAAGGSPRRVAAFLFAGGRGARARPQLRARHRRAAARADVAGALAGGAAVRAGPKRGRSSRPWCCVPGAGRPSCR